MLVIVSSVACGVGQGGEEGATSGGEVGDGRSSKFFVLDAESLHKADAAVAAEVSLPGAVPYGLHSVWMPNE